MRIPSTIIYANELDAAGQMMAWLPVATKLDAEVHTMKGLHP